jgi:hypothetical protein
MCDSDTEDEDDKKVVEGHLRDIEDQQNRIDALLTGINSVKNESEKAITALGVFQDVWQAV